MINSTFSRICWTQLLSYHTNGNYSHEIWCKYTKQASDKNTPLPMFYDYNDNLWCAGFSITNNSSGVAWTNDSSDIFNADTTKWHHYAVSCDSNHVVRYFIDGKILATRTCDTSSLYDYFAIMEQWGGRGELAYAQFAFWSTCKWTQNFTVDRTPIMKLA